jgi:O-antigen ligase
LAALIAIGPFLTASRGGVLMVAGLLPCCLLVLFLSRRTSLLVRTSLVLVLAVLVGVGWHLGGATLAKRFEKSGDDHLGGREPVYEVGARMEKDYRIWGSGAETFTRLYVLYRESLEQHWHAYAHDDYLCVSEFGWLWFCTVIIIA